MSVTIDEVAEQWFVDLAFNGRSQLTIRDHRKMITRYIKWLQYRRLDWREVTRQQIGEYMRTFSDKGHSLRSNMGCTLRMFYSYAVMFEYVSSSPAIVIKTPKAPKPVPRALSRGQIRRLIDYLASQEGRRARRNEIIVMTALYTGARAGEVCRLVWEDIDIPGDCITIRDGKSGGRVVALHPALADMLTRWRELQADGVTVRSDTPVFALDEQGERGIKGTRLGKICYALSKEIGFTVHAHALRHSAATHAIRSGAGLWNVSRMLGHSSTTTTTSTYLRADPTDSISAVRALPNPDEW
jgi:integrase